MAMQHVSVQSPAVEWWELVPLLTDLREIRIIPFESLLFFKCWHTADDAVEPTAETGSRSADFRHRNTCAVLFVFVGLHYSSDQANGIVFELLTHFILHPNNLPHAYLCRDEEEVCVGKHFNPSLKTFSCVAYWYFPNIRLWDWNCRQQSDPLSQNIHTADTHEAVMLIHCDNKYQKPQDK